MADSRPPEETSKLLERLARGDRTVLGPLLARHGDRLHALAREHRRRYKLNEAEYGDDDAAIEALFALWEQAKAGKLSTLATREGYWKAVGEAVKRKVRAAWDRLRRKKRGGSGIPHSGRRAPADGAEAGEPAARALPRRSSLDEVDEELPSVPPLQERVDDADELRHFLERLDGQYLREIVLLVLEGYTREEIAQRLGTTSRTVRRKLARIGRILGESGYGP